MTAAYTLLALTGLAGLTAGCGTLKTTQTPRTALEQALLSEAAVRALKGFRVSGVEGKKFFLDTSQFKAVDQEIIVARLHETFLQAGMMRAGEAKDADIIIHPSVDYAGIDRATILWGLPPIPFPIPSVGTITTPELALFKRDSQYGRNKMAAYGVERESGRLAFSIPPSSGQAYYSRWTFLIAFGFKTSDMPEPYSGIFSD